MKCTICGKDNLSVLSRTLRRGNGTVYYCDECDMGLLEPCYKDAKEYYDKEYRKKFTDDLKKPSSDPEEMFRLQSMFHTDRVDIVRKYFDKKKNFLEIGCSAGQFLTHVYKKFSRYVGTELDTNCAAFVEKKFGVKVYTEELDKCDFKGEKFDYIAFYQVLEHTSNPLQFLADVKKLLKKDGKIFVEVPNLYDPLLHLWKVESYKGFYYHEAHTYYFTKKALRKLFMDAGFKIGKMHFLQDYNLYNNLYWYFNNAPQPDCVFGLSEPHIKFQDGYEKVSCKLNKLFQKSDAKYKKILAENELTSNIFITASGEK